jgi:hypothetical protein
LVAEAAVDEYCLEKAAGAQMIIVYQPALLSHPRMYWRGRRCDKQAEANQGKGKPSMR